MNTPSVKRQHERQIKYIGSMVTLENVGLTNFEASGEHHHRLALVPLPLDARCVYTLKHSIRFNSGENNQTNKEIALFAYPLGFSVILTSPIRMMLSRCGI